MQDDESIIYICHTRFILKMFTAFITSIDTTNLRPDSAEAARNAVQIYNMKLPFKALLFVALEK